MSFAFLRFAADASEPDPGDRAAGPRRIPAQLAELAWGTDRLPEALVELARHAGFAVGQADVAGACPLIDGRNPAELGRYLAWLGHGLGLEVEPVATGARGLEALLRGGGPAILRLDSAAAPVFLLLLGRAGRKSESLRLLGPDLKIHLCPLRPLADAICARYQAPLRHDLRNALQATGLSADRRDDVVDALARARLADTQIAGTWMLRRPATASFRQRWRESRLTGIVAALAALFVLSYALEIWGWGMIGHSILQGRRELGWMAAWALLLLSAVLVRYAGARLNLRLSLGVGRIVKTRLLHGALRFDTQQLRHLGNGQLLAQAMEAQAFESVVSSGGLALVFALVELVLAGFILAAGAGGWLHVLCLTLWVALIGGFGWHYYAALSGWTDGRMRLTHRLVERMTGHRTVLAQESPARRHRQDDTDLSGYLHRSRRLDAAVIPFQAGLPAGWSLVALLGLAPAFVTGRADPIAIAIAAGGILFAGRALATICGGLAGLARAAIAWQRMGGLLAAGGGADLPGAFIPETDLRAAPGARSLIDARGISFAFEPGGRDVLKDASLSVRSGERILVEGSSGSGKSTLASILTGLRQPQAGLVTLNGLDRHTLGPAWHRLVTEAPQFHENHVFSGPLAYNLLMGRRWPGTEEDLAEARAVCEELGLGELLERMPSGLMQIVGETGWQLSHGEKSRIYLARAVLQDAAVTILDESFAALDPETLQRCIDCCVRRTKTLLVIAHP